MNRPLRPWPHWRTLLVSPLLYAMFAPLVLLDGCLEVYHRVAFPILGIQTVRRRHYIKIDRYRLPYLPPILKLACACCGYANGLLQYAAKIAGETEHHFCPIKHQPSAEFQAPPHHAAFEEYGDEIGWRQRWLSPRSRNPRRSIPVTSARKEDVL